MFITDYKKTPCHAWQGEILIEIIQLLNRRMLLFLDSVVINSYRCRNI